MATSPFVNFRMNPTSGIGSTPVIIFGNDACTCLIDGIILANTTNNVIVVTLTVAREVTIGAETYFTLGGQISIQPNDRVDVLLNATLTLQPGDLLYASSDYSSNLFNSFVSYRELTELDTPFNQTPTQRSPYVTPRSD
jgi:hypothetical protein